MPLKRFFPHARIAASSSPISSCRAVADQAPPVTHPRSPRDAGLVAFLLRRDGDSGDDCAPGDEEEERRLQDSDTTPTSDRSSASQRGESLGGADGVSAEPDGAGDGSGPPLHAAVGAAVSAAKDEVAERVRALLLLSRAGDDSPRTTIDESFPLVDDSAIRDSHSRDVEPAGPPPTPVLTVGSLAAPVAPPLEGEAEIAAGEWQDEEGAADAEEETEAEGEWGPRVYMRGFMSLWRGMRGELKQDARAREERRQGEGEGRVEENIKGKEKEEGLAGMVEPIKVDAEEATQGAAAEVVTGVGDGSKEESVVAESFEGGESKKPARASAWALGMLKDWRRQQRQEEQAQPQKQSDGKPVLLTAEEATTAEQATSSAPAAAPVQSQGAELKGPLLQELKVEEGKLGMREAGTEDVIGLAASGVGLPGGRAGAATDAGGKQAARKAVSCNTCNSCKAFAATAAGAAGATSEINAEGTAPAAAAAAAGKGAMWVQHTADSLRPFLQPASGEELWRVSLLAWLCEKAYSIPRLDTKQLHRRFGLTLVTSSHLLAAAQAEAAAAAAAAASLAKQKAKAARAAAAAAAAAAPAAAPPTATSPPAAAAAAESTSPVSVSHPMAALPAGPSMEHALLPAPAIHAALPPPHHSPAPSPSAASVALAPPAAAGSKTAAAAAAAGSEGEDAGSGQSPCAWYICDDEATNTRYIVIQGSESVASWQANLSFDPVPFEDAALGVLVHRGIYTAAKALDLHAHRSRPHPPRVQFTGHSLGGSLAALLSLLLHLRGEASPHHLLPVALFGSPSIMCGGDRLLGLLGLEPEEAMWNVVMARDLVPRAFTCEYPSHITEVLRRVSGALRKHPCLLSQRLVYAPMGHMMVLQPDPAKAPPHPLLPPGTALYHLAHPSAPIQARLELRAAQLAFLNNPHPLETLSDPAAYGTEGTISRDHDPRNYTGTLTSLALQAVRRVRQQRREREQEETRRAKELAERQQMAVFQQQQRRLRQQLMQLVPRRRRLVSKKRVAKQKRGGKQDAVASASALAAAAAAASAFLATDAGKGRFGPRNSLGSTSPIFSSADSASDFFSSARSLPQGAVTVRFVAAAVAAAAAAAAAGDSAAKGRTGSKGVVLLLLVAAAGDF
ncbi:unnamed protein product [Closterium sp. Naga37s-1]|nr:unnamed protein product [Closterium sp. Naga37s-1]